MNNMKIGDTIHCRGPTGKERFKPCTVLSPIQAAKYCHFSRPLSRLFLVVPLHVRHFFLKATFRIVAMDIWRPKTRAAPSRYPVMQSNLVWLLAALGLRRCSKWVPSPHIIPTYLSSFGHLLYFLSCNVHREPGSLEVIIHVMLGIQSLAWQLVATLTPEHYLI